VLLGTHKGWGEEAHREGEDKSKGIFPDSIDIFLPIRIRGFIPLNITSCSFLIVLQEAKKNIFLKLFAYKFLEVHLFTSFFKAVLWIHDI
jgi:hypothetical protein